MTAPTPHHPPDASSAPDARLIAALQALRHGEPPVPPLVSARILAHARATSAARPAPAWQRVLRGWGLQGRAGPALAATVVLGVLVGGVLLQRPGQTPESGTVVALESVPAATTVPVAAEAPGVARAVSSDRVAAVPAPDMATAVRSAPPAPAPATAGAATATAPGPTPAPVRAKAAAVAPSDTVAVAASPTAPVESATAPLADATAALPPAARVQAQTLEPLQSFTEAATVEALRTSLQLLVEQTRGTWRTAPWDGAASVVPVPNTTTLTLRSPPRPPPAALASSLAPLELTLSDSRGTATLRLDADGLSLCRTDEVPCWRAPLSPEQRDAVAQRWRAMQR